MTDLSARVANLTPEQRRLLLERLRSKGAPEPQQAQAARALPTVVARPEERYEPFPLTEIQQAYWVGRSRALELGGVACHVYREFETADLDLGRLERAVQLLLQRHDMLRAIVRPDGRQQVLPETPHRCAIRRIDVWGREPQEVSAKLDEVRREMSHQVLPCDRAPLFDIRASLLDEKRIRLHCSLDVLVSDARSLDIFFRELQQLYENPDAPLAPVTLSFRDYVLAARGLEDSDLYRRSRDYWMNRLPALPPAPDLPLAKSPAAVKNVRFARRAARLEAPLWRQVKSRAGRAGVTPSGLLLAAFTSVLAAWSKNPKFTLNLTLFNRLPLHPQVNDVIGDFTSVTMLEVDATSSNSFEAHARRLQQQLWADLDHRHFGGVQVLRELAKRQGGSHGAAMPVVFTSLLQDDGDSAKPGPMAWLGDLVYEITQTPQVWLDYMVGEDRGDLLTKWDAVEELFPERLLDDMFDAYGRLLRRLATDDAIWQGGRFEIERELLPPAQRQQREAVNATEAPVSGELLQTLFARQVEQRPDQPAVIAPALTLTYAELSRRANQVAHWLRQHGARPNTLVAVVMEKGWEQVVAVLGVVESGAAYLPIDATLPRERLEYLLSHGQASLVLTQSSHDEAIEWPGGIERLSVDRSDQLALDDSPLEPVQKPTDLAYVIYTSGSTGLPKGVVIDHRGAVNTILDINQRFSVTPGDRVFALSALNFDLSVYDIFGLLAAGGTVVMPEPFSERNPEHWVELLAAHHVTIWDTVPALMQMLVEYVSGRSEPLPPSLRLVMMSGDWIPIDLPDRIKALGPGIDVFSLGGATEASIWSILYPIDRVDPSWTSIPYGRPMVNQTFHVLDDALAPRPVWVPGSLYIGGIGVALGYWRDEEKTRASFITHAHTGERLYRTGDLGRYLPDGNIEFLGREDFQVKIRGHRIELGEIEAALLQHPEVQSAVVAAAGEARGNNRWLVAYVVRARQETAGEIPDGAAADDAPAPSVTPADDLAESLREFAGSKLPDYMVPATVMFLDALPLSSNGKVDRKALPAPGTDRPADSATYVAPRDATEEKLAEIWRDALHLDRIGVHDNFFELGGDSVMAIQIIARANRLGFQLAANHIFECQTIAELAEKAGRVTPAAAAPAIARQPRRAVRRPVAQAS